MSHKKACGCVIADSKDSDVRRGFALGGYIKQRCDKHIKEQEASIVKEAFEKSEEATIKRVADAIDSYLKYCNENFHDLPEDENLSMGMAKAAIDAYETK